MIPTIVDPPTPGVNAYCIDFPYLLNSNMTAADCLAIRWETITVPNIAIVQPEDVIFSSPNGFQTYVTVPYPGIYCFSAVCIYEL